MFLELALVFPIYILVFYALIRYRHVIKAMSSLDSLLSTLTDEDLTLLTHLRKELYNVKNVRL